MHLFLVSTAIAMCGYTFFLQGLSSVINYVLFDVDRSVLYVGLLVMLTQAIIIAALLT
jgi:hypothetical protein